MMKKQDEQRLVPKLRFKGFTDDWEQRELHELVNFSKGKGYSKKDIVESGTPFMRYGNLYTDFEIEITAIKESVEEKPKSVKSKGGEILVPSSGETPGEIARASTLLKRNVIIGGDINILTVKNNNVLPTFLALDLNTNRNSKELSKYAVGNSVVHLYNKDLHRLKIYLPDIEIQKKIVSIWRTLDKLLTLHKRRMNVLQQLKNYYHFKLFNIKKKKRTLYFEKFKEEKWRSLKIADIASVSIGEFVKKTKQDPDYPYPVYNGGTTPTGYYNEFNNLENQIVISARGANAGYCNFVNTKYWAGNSSYSLVLKNNNKNDIKFIYYNMIFNKNRLLGLKQSANIPSVSKKDIENLCVFVPNINEQKYISKVLDEISELIILSKIQIKVINKLKTTYLNNLFI